MPRFRNYSEYSLFRLVLSRSVSWQDPHGSVQGSALENNSPPPNPNPSIFSPPRAQDGEGKSRNTSGVAKAPPGIEAQVSGRPSRAGQERSQRPPAEPRRRARLPQPRRSGRSGPRCPGPEPAGARPEQSRRPRQPRPCLTAPSPVPWPRPAPLAAHLALPGPGLPPAPPARRPHAPDARARPAPRCPMAATAAQRAPAHPPLLPRQARPLGPPPLSQPITARRRCRCAALLARSAASHKRIRGFPEHRACMSRRGGGGRRSTPPIEGL